MRLLHSKFLHLPSNLLCHTGVSGLYLVLGEKVRYIHHLSCFFPIAPLLSAVNIRAVGRLLKVERLRVQEYAFDCEVVEKFFEHTHNDAVQTNRRVKETSIIEGSKFKFHMLTNALLPIKRPCICWVQQVSEFSHIMVSNFLQADDRDLLTLTDQKMLPTPGCTMHYASSLPFWVFWNQVCVALLVLHN